MDDTVEMPDVICNAVDSCHIKCDHCKPHKAIITSVVQSVVTECTTDEYCQSRKCKVKCEVIDAL